MVVIAVSGQPASGKTTIARKLAEYYGLRYVSNGMLFRRLAEEKGIPFLEFHKLAEQDENIDRQIDSMALEEAKKGNVVIEGHLAGWVLKDVADVKIYLKASLEVRARRLAQRENMSIEDAIREITFREENNRKRYLKIYGIDIKDLSVFDIVLDTTYLDVDEVLEILRSYIDKIIRKKRSNT
ncbi:MAG: AAA family ATPase [Crenarchaeota archaeon]|jgi:cytidylate kinase|nr:AAA family ATPase [Thermoproteota archaeon]